MCFFSRRRASASTSSFQRSVVHSGLRKLAAVPDSAVWRLACDDLIGPGRSLVFRPSVGTALDVDMSHLRSVIAGAVIETAVSDCAGLSGATRLMVPGCRKPVGAHMGIDPHSYRDRHPIPCEGRGCQAAVRRGPGVQPSPKLRVSGAAVRQSSRSRMRELPITPSTTCERTGVTGAVTPGSTPRIAMSTPGTGRTRSRARSTELNRTPPRGPKHQLRRVLSPTSTRGSLRGGG